MMTNIGKFKFLKKILLDLIFIQSIQNKIKNKHSIKSRSIRLIFTITVILQQSALHAVRGQLIHAYSENVSHKPNCFVHHNSGVKDSIVWRGLKNDRILFLTAKLFRIDYFFKAYLFTQVFKLLENTLVQIIDEREDNVLN